MITARWVKGAPLGLNQFLAAVCTIQHRINSLFLLGWWSSAFAGKIRLRWMCLRCLRDLGQALFGIKMGILSPIIMSFAAPLISGLVVLICFFVFFLKSYCIACRVNFNLSGCTLWLLCSYFGLLIVLKLTGVCPWMVGSDAWNPDIHSRITLHNNWKESLESLL